MVDVGQQTELQIYSDLKYVSLEANIIEKFSIKGNSIRAYSKFETPIWNPKCSREYPSASEKLEYLVHFYWVGL